MIFSSVSVHFDRFNLVLPYKSKMRWKSWKFIFQWSLQSNFGKVFWSGLVWSLSLVVTKCSVFVWQVCTCSKQVSLFLLHFFPIQPCITHTKTIYYSITKGSGNRTLTKNPIISLFSQVSTTLKLKQFLISITILVNVSTTATHNVKTSKK